MSLLESQFVWWRGIEYLKEIQTSLFLSFFLTTLLYCIIVLYVQHDELGWALLYRNIYVTWHQSNSDDTWTQRGRSKGHEVKWSPWHHLTYSTFLSATPAPSQHTSLRSLYASTRSWAAATRNRNRNNRNASAWSWATGPIHAPRHIQGWTQHSTTLPWLAHDQLPMRSLGLVWCCTTPWPVAWSYPRLNQRTATCWSWDTPVSYK